MKPFNYVLEIQHGFMASDNKYNPEPHYKVIENKVTREDYLALIATIPDEGGEFMFKGEPNIVERKTADLQTSIDVNVKREMRLVLVIITKAMEEYYGRTDEEKEVCECKEFKLNLKTFKKCCVVCGKEKPLD